MALEDYLLQRKSSEQRLSDIVTGRNVDDELTRMKKNVGDLRNRFLTRTQELTSKVGGTGGRSAFARVGELDAKTQAVLARKKLQLQRTKMQAVFNNAYEMAVQYGMDEQSANEYARRIAAQQSEQTYGASEADKDRAQKRKMDKLGEQFGIARLNLSDEFTTKPDYAKLLLAQILGVGTNIGISEMLRRRNRGMAVPKSVETSQYDYGSSRSV